MEEHDLINIFDSFDASDFKKIYIDKDINNANLKSPLTPSERKDLILNKITQSSSSLSKNTITNNMQDVSCNNCHNTTKKHIDETSEQQHEHNVLFNNYTKTYQTYKRRFIAAAAFIIITCTLSIALYNKGTTLFSAKICDTKSNGYSSLGGNQGLLYGSDTSKNTNILNNSGNLNASSYEKWTQCLDTTLTDILGTFPDSNSDQLKYNFIYNPELKGTYPIETTGLIDASGILSSHIADYDNDLDYELLVFYYENKIVYGYMYDVVDNEIVNTSKTELYNTFTTNPNRQCGAVTINEDNSIISESHSASLFDTTVTSYIKIMSYSDNSFTQKYEKIDTFDTTTTSSSVTQSDLDMFENYGFKQTLINNEQRFLFENTNKINHLTIFTTSITSDIYNDISKYLPKNLTLDDIQNYNFTNNSKEIENSINNLPEITAVIDVN